MKKENDSMSMLKRLAQAAAIAAGLALAAPAAAQEPAKIGFVYPGPVGDTGWAFELDTGRKAVEEKFGDKVETIVAENIPEGPDAARVMNQMAADGAKMIMLGSFGYMNDGLKLARQYPDIAFIHASGYKLAPNFGTFLSRNYETAYAAGLAAGYLTKTNILGVVAAYPIPEVVGMLNAYVLGAQKTNPDVTAKVVWLNSWFDPNKSQEGARSLVAQDADVIFSLYQDTPEVVALAEELGVYSISTSSDMKAYAPEKYLGGLVVDWRPHFIDQVGKMLDGTFKGEAYWGGYKDGAIELSSLTPDLTPEQRKVVDDAIAEMKAGAFHPMTGPIIAQDGTEKVAAGETMSDEDLLGINWLVKGVETKIPN
jgi:basic membrane protein A